MSTSFVKSLKRTCPFGSNRKLVLWDESLTPSGGVATCVSFALEDIGTRRREKVTIREENRGAVRRIELPETGDHGCDQAAQDDFSHLEIPRFDE
jgi:hypothetical protein